MLRCCLVHVPWSLTANHCPQPLPPPACGGVTLQGLQDLQRLSGCMGLSSGVMAAVRDLAAWVRANNDCYWYKVPPGTSYFFNPWLSLLPSHDCLRSCAVLWCQACGAGVFAWLRLCTKAFMRNPAAAKVDPSLPFCGGKPAQTQSSWAESRLLTALLLVRSGLVFLVLLLVQAAKGAHLPHVESLNWRARSVALITHSPGSVSVHAISLFLWVPSQEHRSLCIFVVCLRCLGVLLPVPVSFQWELFHMCMYFDVFVMQYGWSGSRAPHLLAPPCWSSLGFFFCHFAYLIKTFFFQAFFILSLFLYHD